VKVFRRVPRRNSSPQYQWAIFRTEFGRRAMVQVYVALENGEMAVAIDTVSNKVIAQIPIGQTTQALVYVPNAVPPAMVLPT